MDSFELLLEPFEQLFAVVIEQDEDKGRVLPLVLLLEVFNIVGEFPCQQKRFELV